MSNVIIRKASTDDTVTLARLAERTFLDAFERFNEPKNIRAYVKRAFSPAQIAKELMQENSQFFVAERDSTLIAYAKIRDDEVPDCIQSKSVMELERIYVLQAFIGNGIGQMLLDTVIEAARDAQRSVLWLGVWENNPGAVRFYHHFGFKTVGSKDFMMGPEKQTDHIMQLSLD